MSTIGAPPHRDYAAAAWTGSEFVVWGGDDGSGEAYDLATDTWRPLGDDGAPAGRQHHAMVWTGDRLLVFGGSLGRSGDYAATTSDGLYDPATDTWTAISEVGAPTPRAAACMHWTGDELLIWGGFENDSIFGDGGAYRPGTDTWRPLATAGAPSPRWNMRCAWTGTELVVFGGVNAEDLRRDMFAYDPTTDTWRSLTASAELVPATHAVATQDDVVLVSPGLRVVQVDLYDLATNTWRRAAAAPADLGTLLPSVALAGDQLVLWGGSAVEGDASVDTNAGAFYAPAIDTWRSMTQVGAPSPRADAFAAWTGSELIVWGGVGLDEGGALTTGGVFTP